jgi:transcriptional regulator with XRE-family HTH domain
MQRTFDEIMRDLPADRQNKIRSRALQLASLKQIRLATNTTQSEIATLLGIGQDSVSRLEKREDMLISTLRQYIEGLGGELEIVAKFPDHPPMLIYSESVDKK